MRTILLLAVVLICVPSEVPASDYHNVCGYLMQAESDLENGVFAGTVKAVTTPGWNCKERGDTFTIRPTKIVRKIERGDMLQVDYEHFVPGWTNDLPTDTWEVTPVEDPLPVSWLLAVATTFAVFGTAAGALIWLRRRET